jgi:hypothetical protein
LDSPEQADNSSQQWQSPAHPHDFASSLAVAANLLKLSTSGLSAYATPRRMNRSPPRLAEAPICAKAPGRFMRRYRRDETDGISLEATWRAFPSWGSRDVTDICSLLERLENKAKGKRQK